MNFLQVIGSRLIVATAIHIFSLPKGKILVRTYAFMAVTMLTGLVIILADRITDVSITGIGNLKAATMQATVDAEEVSKIKKRVESQSATIDLIAEKSDAVQKEMDAKTSLIDQKLMIANASVKSLDILLKFNLNVTAAQNGSRKAYDQIYIWSKDKDFSYSEMAGKAYDGIQLMYELQFRVQEPRMGFREGIKEEDISIQTFNDAFKKCAEENNLMGRIQIIEYIGGRSRFGKKEKMLFLADILDHEESMELICRAAPPFSSTSWAKLKTSRFTENPRMVE